MNVPKKPEQSVHRPLDIGRDLSRIMETPVLLVLPDSTLRFEHPEDPLGNSRTIVVFEPEQGIEVRFSRDRYAARDNKLVFARLSLDEAHEPLQLADNDGNAYETRDLVAHHYMGDQYQVVEIDGEKVDDRLILSSESSRDSHQLVVGPGFIAE